MSSVAHRAGKTPLGILLIAALLAVAGTGSLGAGAYLTLANDGASLWAGLVSLVIGPAMLYLAYHLIALARWAWLTLLLFVGLLFLSSAARFVIVPGARWAALVEIVAELALGYYLTRERIRARFG